MHRRCDTSVCVCVWRGGGVRGPRKRAGRGGELGVLPQDVTLPVAAAAEVAPRGQVERGRRGGRAEQVEKAAKRKQCRLCAARHTSSGGHSLAERTASPVETCATCVCWRRRWAGVSTRTEGRQSDTRSGRRRSGPPGTVNRSARCGRCSTLLSQLLTMLLENPQAA